MSKIVKQDCRRCVNPDGFMGATDSKGVCILCRGKGYTEYTEYKYQIEDEELNYQNDGAFLSVRLDAFGDTYEEMAENATITAVDQDGGEAWTEKAFGYCGSIDREVEQALAFEILRVAGYTMTLQKKAAV